MTEDRPRPHLFRGRRADTGQWLWICQCPTFTYAADTPGQAYDEWAKAWGRGRTEIRQHLGAWAPVFYAGLH